MRRTMTILPQLLLLILATTALPGQSPTWVKSPVTGKHYTMIWGYGNWTRAKAEAQKIGGIVATIESKAEVDWICTTYRFKSRTLIIGYNDHDTEGKWVWASGSKSTYTNWYPNVKLPVSGPTQNYTLLFTYGTGVRGYWISTSTNGLTNVLVERFDAVSSSFGVGCASTVTKPTITMTPPRFGTKSTVEVKGFLPTAQPGVLALGFQGSGDVIPVAIGSGPCSLLIPVDIQAPIGTTTQGTFKTDVLVPNDPSMAGLTIYLQAWAPDPTNAPLGLAMTNAVEATLGH